VEKRAVRQTSAARDEIWLRDRHTRGFRLAYCHLRFTEQQHRTQHYRSYNHQSINNRTVRVFSAATGDGMGSDFCGKSTEGLKGVGSADDGTCGDGRGGISSLGPEEADFSLMISTGDATVGPGTLAPTSIFSSTSGTHGKLSVRSSVSTERNYRTLKGRNQTKT
jgi:hypothetical protein